jgi:hypothetical protein
VIEAVVRLTDLQQHPLNVSQAVENGSVRPRDGRGGIPGVQGVEDRVATLVVAQLVDLSEVFRIVVVAPAIVIVKGSVGKIGIVPPNVPEPGPGAWVAGQSAIVLRQRDNPQVEIDPRVLLVQLRSPIGQELLTGIVSGASIPLIQLRELMRLPVPLPDPAQ